MNAPNEDIVNKVRALLRKTETAGCTAEEAEAAQMAAARMMAKHNIDKVVVENAEANAAMRDRLNLVKEYFNTGRDKCYTDDYIMRILRQCFGVKVFYTTTFEGGDWAAYEAALEVYKKTAEAWRANKENTDWSKHPKRPKQPRSKDRFTYVIVGDEPDVKLAGGLVAEFRRIMRHLFARYLEAEGLPWNAASATAFYSGFASTYTRANEVAVREAMLEAGKAQASTYALAVVDKAKAVEEFTAKTVQTVRARAGSGGGARSGFDMRANLAGEKSAKGLNLKNRKLQ